MRLLLRRFAAAVTVIACATFILAGSSVVSARAKLALTGETQTTLWLSTRGKMLVLRSGDRRTELPLPQWVCTLLETE